MGEGLKRARAAARATRAKPAGADLRKVVIEECAKCVPTTWLDPLLSGPGKVGDLPGVATVKLLQAVADRIRALKSNHQ